METMKNVNELENLLPKYPIVQGSFIPHRGILYHEASHAFMIIHKGYYPTKISYDPPFTEFEFQKLSVRNQIEVHMAGAVGQALYAGNYVFSETDERNIIETAKNDYYNTSDVALMWENTHRALVDNWSKVRLISLELSKKKVLFTEDLKRILL